MYQVVIIGAGNIAAGFDSPESFDILTHAHAFSAHPSFQICGFYDKDLTKAFDAANIWGGQAYKSLEAALKDADVVICCVSDAFHGEVLKKIAAYSPKLVIAEKPLAASWPEAVEIKALYADKIPLAVNYSRRFIKEFQELKTAIKKYGRFLRGAGYYGKGILHNGSHMLDILSYLLGRTEIMQVLPTAVDDFGPEDLSRDVILKIQDGLFHMEAIDSRIVTIFEIELFFEKCRIRILDGGKVIEKYQIQESDTYKGYKNYTFAERQNVNYSNAMQGLAENIREFLDNGSELECTLEDGLDVLRTCMQIRGDSI